MIEYAPEYPKAEKYRRLLLTFLLAVFIIITHEKWVFPFISWYADTVHCHSPLGFSGISVLWYSLFVGLPLFSGLLVAIPLVPLGVKGLRDRQFPPKGVKVYKPTKIIRGWQANVKSAFHILVPIFFLLMAVWGYFQAAKMPQEAAEDFDYSLCKTQ